MQIALGVPWLDRPLVYSFRSLVLIRIIFWLEILQIGTLRARYRAEYRNVASAKVSTSGDDGEAHVSYEDSDEERLTKKKL